VNVEKRRRTDESFFVDWNHDLYFRTKKKAESVSQFSVNFSNKISAVQLTFKHGFLHTKIKKAVIR